MTNDAVLPPRGWFACDALDSGISGGGCDDNGCGPHYPEAWTPKGQFVRRWSSLTIIPTQKQFLCTVAEFLQLSILLKQASASSPIPCPTCTHPPARGAIQAMGRSVQANVVAFHALQGSEEWSPLTVHVRAASSHMNGCDAGVTKPLPYVSLHSGKEKASSCKIHKNSFDASFVYAFPSRSDGVSSTRLPGKCRFGGLLWVIAGWL